MIIIIVAGIGILFSGIFETPWPLIVSAIAIGTFLARKILATGWAKVSTRWSGRSSTTPTAGAAPAKSKLPIWLKWCLWIGGIAIVTFSAYKWWSLLEDLGRGILDSANNTITKEITIDSLRGTSWDDIPKGTYVISLSGPGYLYKCHPEKPGTRDGYPEGKRADGGKMDGWTGGIRISSPLTANKKGNRGTVIIGADRKAFVSFDVECPDTGTVVYPVTASVRLTPKILK